jgi:hypothetical protein
MVPPHADFRLNLAEIVPTGEYAGGIEYAFQTD